MTELFDLLENHGVTLVIAGIFLMFVIHAYTKVGPKLEAIDASLIRSAKTEDALQSLVKTQHEAMEQFSKSNENVAHSLELLRMTLEGIAEDVKENKERLDRHDTFSQKIYTTEMVNRKLNEMILSNLTTPREAKESVKEARYYVREKMDTMKAQEGYRDLTV